MNTRDFLLEGLIYEAVLLYYRDPFKCLARNGNGVEGPTATYNEDKKLNLLLVQGRGQLGGAPETSCTSSSEGWNRSVSLS